MQITINDYLPYVKQDRLESIIQDNEAILLAAQVTAIEKVKTYLFQRYNTEDIFSATGSNRHPLILQMLIHISLYDLYDRLPNFQLPEKRVKNYDECITLLERIADGKQAIDLPTRNNSDNTPITKAVFFSNPKRSHEF